MYVPKRMDFIEDPKEDILGKSKFSSLWSVLESSYHSIVLQEVRILSTLVYFHPKACLTLFPPLGAVWLCFLS